MTDDLQLCVDLWTRIHGLTVAQCEQVYVAAHIDRNFTADVDRKLIDAMIDAFKQANDTTTVDSVNSEFDKAVAESVKNNGARLEVNGETLTFEDGLVIEVGSTRYEAYFTIRNGRKNFYYRGNRVSKKDFFTHIATQDKALAERAAIGEFVAKYGGSEFKPGTNPHGNFVAQIHPTLANGRQDNYEVTFDDKAAAYAFIDEFKTLAGDMKFLATIKRGSFYGEEIYRHGLNGQEFFAPDVDAEALNTNWKDAQRRLDGRITVEIQGGGTCAIDKDSDIRLTKIKDGYAFVDYGEVVAVGAKVVLARYDTPAQVKEVIDEFSKTIIGNRFEFPHVEDIGKSTVELAEELTALLLKVTPCYAGFMDLTLQDGKTTAASPRTAIIEPDWHGNGRFAFVTPWNEIFARYDTASQVRTVIYRIKHAVEDKRDKFKYPTVAELSAPDYREKQWAVDFDIYHTDSDLTDAELESYTDKLREALTANGNRACVELEDSVITIYGDLGGDNDTVDKIVAEMCKRGCWVEYPEEEGDANEKARLC